MLLMATHGDLWGQRDKLEAELIIKLQQGLETWPLKEKNYPRGTIFELN